MQFGNALGQSPLHCGTANFKWWARLDLDAAYDLPLAPHGSPFQTLTRKSEGQRDRTGQQQHTKDEKFQRVIRTHTEDTRRTRPGKKQNRDQHCSGELHI